MKILAVSDMQSKILEKQVSSVPEQFKDIDLIVSCGDLRREYLEFVAEGLNKRLVFVTGNHPFEMSRGFQNDELPGEAMIDRTRYMTTAPVQYIAGGSDLHGRIEVHDEYLILGFGGAMWYNGKENQYTEKEMTRIVRQVERKLQWARLQETLFGVAPREVIVVSHAPVLGVHDQPDVCHQGFKCFADFLQRTAPLLWLHGHVHLPDERANQVSVVGGTTVVNAYGCKIIQIADRHIDVFSHCMVDNQDSK